MGSRTGTAKERLAKTSNARSEARRFRASRTGMALVPIALALGLAAPWVVPAVYGSEYAASLALIPFFLVFTVVAAFNIGHGAAYLVDSRVAAINVRTALQFLVVVLVGVPLIYNRGAIGAGMSYVIAAVFALAFDYVLIWRASRPKPEVE